MVLRIEHFVRTGQAGVLNDPHMQISGGNDALEQVRPALRIRLMQQPFVTVSCGPGLIGIDTGNDEDMILYFLLDRGQTVHVIQNAVFVIRGAGADDQKDLVAAAGKDIQDLPVPFFLDPAHIGGGRELLLDLHGDCQFSFKIHIHNHDLFHSGSGGFRSVPGHAALSEGQVRRLPSCPRTYCII